MSEMGESRSFQHAHRDGWLWRVYGDGRIELVASTEPGDELLFPKLTIPPGGGVLLIPPDIRPAPTTADEDAFLDHLCELMTRPILDAQELLDEARRLGIRHPERYTAWALENEVMMLRGLSRWRRRAMRRAMRVARR